MPTTPCTSSKHKALSSSTNQSVSGQVALKPADLNRSGIIRESSKHATEHNKLQSDALELRSWDESNTLVTKQTLSGLTEPDPFGFLKQPFTAKRPSFYINPIPAQTKQTKQRKQPSETHKQKPAGGKRTATDETNITGKIKHNHRDESATKPTTTCIARTTSLTHEPCDGRTKKARRRRLNHGGRRENSNQAKGSLRSG